MGVVEELVQKVATILILIDDLNKRLDALETYMVKQQAEHLQPPASFSASLISGWPAPSAAPSDPEILSGSLSDSS